MQHPWQMWIFGRIHTCQAMEGYGRITERKDRHYKLKRCGLLLFDEICFNRASVIQEIQTDKLGNSQTYK